MEAMVINGVVMDEYIQSSDESVVDITFAVFLEYLLDRTQESVVGHDYVSSLSITNGRNAWRYFGFFIGWSDISQLLEILKVHQEFGNAAMVLHCMEG